MGERDKIFSLASFFLFDLLALRIILFPLTTLPTVYKENRCPVWPAIASQFCGGDVPPLTPKMF